MEVEVDIDWVTSGMRIVVDSLVTLSEQQWNMKLTGFEVILRGRMLFVLKLSRTRLPGIVGVAYPLSSLQSRRSRPGTGSQNRGSGVPVQHVLS